jgi:alpha/beta hydrolase family protein
MTSTPIILVPGFWLGAWAWGEVAAALRVDGHDVTALTLPGLESADADRSSITLTDHVEAISEAVRASGAPVVLAVHSGTGFSGYVASDRVPAQIAAMVYVDSAPGIPPLDPNFDGARFDIPSTMICTGYTSEEYKDAVKEGYAWLGGLTEVRNVTWVDLPTSHWPMWSRPKGFAEIIGGVARAQG